MILLAAAVASYLLRIALITLMPADRLPEGVRRALGQLPPAALAALVVTALVAGGGLTALVTPTPTHLALLVAGLVAWRVRNLAVPVLAATAVGLAWGFVF